MPRAEVSLTSVLACASILLAGAASCYLVAAEARTAAPWCSDPYGSGAYATTATGNRTYCEEEVLVAGLPLVEAGNDSPCDHGPTANSMFLGYGFSITGWSCGMGDWFQWNTTIVEPNGTVTQGGPHWAWLGPHLYYSGTWFTTDNESGVVAVSQSYGSFNSDRLASLVLLVEV
jgi:hypothetical protein